MLQTLCIIYARNYTFSSKDILLPFVTEDGNLKLLQISDSNGPFETGTSYVCHANYKMASFAGNCERLLTTSPKGLFQNLNL